MTTDTQPKQEAQPKQKEAQKAPGLRDSPEFRQALSEATSAFQSETAEARKGLKQVKAEINKLQEELVNAKQELEIARLAGNDEEEAARQQERLRLQHKLDDQKKELGEREQNVLKAEGAVSAKILSSQYGIPAQELEKYETVTEMRMAALEYQNAQLLKEKETRSKGDQNGADGDEKESKPLEASEGRRTAAAIPDPIKEPEKWKAYEVEVMRRARAR